LRLKLLSWVSFLAMSGKAVRSRTVCLSRWSIRWPSHEKWTFLWRRILFKMLNSLFSLRELLKLHKTKVFKRIVFLVLTYFYELDFFHKLLKFLFDSVLVKILRESKGFQFRCSFSCLLPSRVILLFINSCILFLQLCNNYWVKTSHFCVIQRCLCVLSIFKMSVHYISGIRLF